MRVSYNDNAVALTIVLSRRNLNSLLAKLDGNPPGSARTIFKDTEDGTRVFITAEEDSAHYGGARPGDMHPSTEAAVAAMENEGG